MEEKMILLLSDNIRKKNHLEFSNLIIRIFLKSNIQSAMMLCYYLAEQKRTNYHNSIFIFFWIKTGLIEIKRKIYNFTISLYSGAKINNYAPDCWFQCDIIFYFF